MPLPENLLEQHLNSVFIETGSNRGDAIGHALKAGFPCVYSVDISQFNFGWCSCRWRELNTKVYLYCDDSREFLRKTLPGITTRCTFWLDAHWCGGNGELEGRDGGTPEDVPLLEELKIIAEHSVKNHTILIDDVRLMTGKDGWPTKKIVRAALERINPDYVLTRVDSLDFERDIVIAHMPNQL